MGLPALARYGPRSSVVRMIVPRSSASSRRVRRGVIVTAVISAIICALVGLAGYFNRDPYELYPAKRGALPIAAVNFSGDMGVRFLLGASTMRGLTEHGVTTMAVVTPALFRRHRTRAEVDATARFPELTGPDAARATDVPEPEGAHPRADGARLLVEGLDFGVLERDVAIKVLHAHLADRAESRARLKREAITVAKGLIVEPSVPIPAPSRMIAAPVTES